MSFSDSPKLNTCHVEHSILTLSFFFYNSQPPYPARVLFKHVAIKGIQIGSVVGVVVLPFIAGVRGQSIARTLKTGLPFFAATGAYASLGLLFGKNYKGDLTLAGVDDRAYRIKNNATQNKVDYYSGIGAVTGITLGAVISGSITAALATSVAGVAIGVASYAGEFYYEKTYNQKLFDTVKTWVDSLM